MRQECDYGEYAGILSVYNQPKRIITIFFCENWRKIMKN